MEVNTCPWTLIPAWMEVNTCPWTLIPAWMEVNTCPWTLIPAWMEVNTCPWTLIPAWMEVNTCPWTLIPAWMEVNTCPCRKKLLSILKLQRFQLWSLGMNKSFHPTHDNGCNYLSMWKLKLNELNNKWLPEHRKKVIYVSIYVNQWHNYLHFLTKWLRYLCTLVKQTDKSAFFIT